MDGCGILLRRGLSDLSTGMRRSHVLHRECPYGADMARHPFPQAPRTRLRYGFVELVDLKRQGWPR